jgi:hypothetical protein
MRQLLVAAALSGTALMSCYGTAVAQVAVEVPGAGVYVGPAYNDGYYYGPRYYRGYGYYDDNHYRTRREQRTDFQQCGRHSYWDGDACKPGRRP